MIQHKMSIAQAARALKISFQPSLEEFFVILTDDEKFGNASYFNFQPSLEEFFVILFEFALKEAKKHALQLFQPSLEEFFVIQFTWSVGVGIIICFQPSLEEFFVIRSSYSETVDISNTMLSTLS